MTLFDSPPPNVRTSDPDTSRAAAVIDRSSIRERVRDALLAHPEGLTDWQLTDVLGLPHRRKPTVTKRRQEVGAVPTELRRLSPDGSPCIVWRLAA